jgi:nitronate monooxygenase
MATNTVDIENSSRRGFIKQGLTLGVGASLSGFNSSPTIGQSPVGIISERSKKLMTLFNLKYPIFQAAPGGEELAIAVSNAGAMGAIQLSWASPEESYKMVTRIKAATKGSFYVNYILNFKPESLDKALEAGASIVEFSWGMPNQTIVSKIRSSNAKFGIQVASKNSAKSALDLGADFLIAQGIEAGGHVQANRPLNSTLQEVLEVAKNVPVLASGGITTGHDIRKAINAGASGAVLGTRFIATKESNIHDEYKNSIIQAGENSTVFTICFNKGWSAQHRVLKNKTFQMWEAVGCPLPGYRPGENDIIATRHDGTKVERYSIRSPMKGFQGQLSELAMYAGDGVNKIKDLPTANDLIQRLWNEYENK